MSKTCIITGKRPCVANQVSHSNRKTKRLVYPSVQKRRLLNPATGRMVRVWISNKGLKTLQKWDREGKLYNLRKLASSK